MPSDDVLEVWLSVASICEILIKASLGCSDFRVDPVEVSRSLLINGYRELSVSGQHALAGSEIPDVLRDPFDRLVHTRD